jgi:hypothetical protein
VSNSELSRTESEERQSRRSELRESTLEGDSKKGIRLCQEDFVCELKLGETDKSVARIRLVKTENPSVCATVNCKVCRTAIAL